MITIKLIKNANEFLIEREGHQISITLEDNILDSKDLFEKIFKLESLDKKFELIEYEKLELKDKKLISYYNDVKKILDDILVEIENL
ncbi:hypothetical protein RZE82_00285 [Mollicutes bacterium LVI A0039]|nr:hypothetical protein RZE82_00285 [Mollicutes bacterium LVI A0039]